MCTWLMKQVYKNGSTIGSNGTNTTVVYNGFVKKKFCQKY